jgi:hypothetical protein
MSFGDGFGVAIDLLQPIGVPSTSLDLSQGIAFAASAKQPQSMRFAKASTLFPTRGSLLDADAQRPPYDEPVVLVVLGIVVVSILCRALEFTTGSPFSRTVAFTKVQRVTRHVGVIWSRCHASR